jgi:hypothetical protein
MKFMLLNFIILKHQINLIDWSGRMEIKCDDDNKLFRYVELLMVIVIRNVKFLWLKNNYFVFKNLKSFYNFFYLTKLKHKFFRNSTR